MYICAKSGPLAPDAGRLRKSHDAQHAPVLPANHGPTQWEFPVIDGLGLFHLQC